MKALCWDGKQKVRLQSISEPRILNPKDAVIEVSTSAIGGSDLHIYNGYLPMEKGHILGHEGMGTVVEVGTRIRNLKVGDRIVVPFNIACGACHFCQEEQYANCDNSNPNIVMAEKLYGHTAAAAFGSSPAFGGYAGSQAEYLRVPYADTNSLKIQDGIPDEKVIFLSDILPTGFMAAENCNIKIGDTVAVWGAGPVGQMAIRSAFMLGADRVIAIDHFAHRLRTAEKGGAETINFDEINDITEELKFRTGGRGPDACIDCVGLESHGHTVAAGLDRMKAAIGLVDDRPDALRQAVHACKKGGVISVPGMYGGFVDRFPFGAAYSKGLTFKLGQTHVQKYMKRLLDLILEDKIDPSFVISHRLHIDDGPEAYRMFNTQKDECMKVVLRMH